MNIDLSSSKRNLKGFLFKLKVYRLNPILKRFYILPFHMIATKPNGFFPEISVEEFEKIMVHIRKYYEIVSLSEIVDRLKGKKSIRGCMAITFDDGFRDNYTVAYPILKKYDIPATIFLSPGFIDTGEVPWFIKVRYIFMQTSLRRMKSDINGQEYDLAMETSRERFLASEKLMQHLKRCEDDERKRLLDKLCEQLGINDFHEIIGLMLTWEQIRAMSDCGISFGAHTMSHPVLARLPLEKAEEEIRESKRKIEVMIKKSIDSFAYPFGKRIDYSESIISVLRKMNFECAVTAKFAPNNPHVNLFELGRCAPWEMMLLKSNRVH